jgi:hypothetical protein
MKKRKPLRRHPDLIPFSREHHKLLLTAQLLKTDVPDYKGMPNTPFGKRTYVTLFLDDLLEPHMQREEEELFANAREHPELVELVKKLERDHAFFRKEIPKLRDLEEEEALTQALDRLGRRLEKHVRLEEREFFQQYQKLMLNAK